MTSKEKAREQICDLYDILCQANTSYWDLVEISEKIDCLAKRHGLIRELKREGIL